MREIYWIRLKGGTKWHPVYTDEHGFCRSAKGGRNERIYDNKQVAEVRQEYPKEPQGDSATPPSTTDGR